MTKISKCLAVGTVVACLAYLSFVSVSVVGGPNWASKMNQEDLRASYVITESEQDEEGNTTFGITSRKAGAAVGGSLPHRPAAIVAARKDFDAQLKSEIQELEQNITEVEDRLAEAREFNEVDTKAMQTRLTELKAELAAINTAIAEVSDEAVARSAEAERVLDNVRQRREDVMRLSNQLEVILTDIYQAERQAERLRDELWRVRGRIDRLKRRNEQLKK